MTSTPGMAPPGTVFIMVYMPSWPPELDESGWKTKSNRHK